MKLINISTIKHPNTFAKVDDEDFEFLNKWKWCGLKIRNCIYAGRSVIGADGRKSTILMHREVLNAPVGMVCDHINHDGLDNRRENLRACTAQQNGRNSRKERGSSSIYKGVFLVKESGKFGAKLCSNGKIVYQAFFVDEASAARAYDAAAKEFFGEFAYLNFPDKKEELCATLP